MPKRRRYATREELEQLLAGRAAGVDWASALNTLAEIGVNVSELVKVTVDEEA